MHVIKEFAVRRCEEVRNDARMKLGSYREQRGEKK